MHRFNAMKQPSEILGSGLVQRISFAPRFPLSRWRRRVGILGGDDVGFDEALRDFDLWHSCGESATRT